MRDLTRYTPAMILLVGALLATAAHDQSAPELLAPLDSLPATIDGFDASDVQISEEERKAAGVTNYLLRDFRRDSVTGFSVYVGYYTYQTQGRTIHSPKNCLPGAGWQALGTGTTLIDAAGESYLVNRYILANGDDRALVYYWYQGRGRIAASEFAVKWDLLRDIALHGRSEEALVRIVVPIARGAGDGAAGSELLAADRVATASATVMIPAVTRILPRWM